MTTYGEVSWNDDLAFGNQQDKKNTKDLFLKLESGSNVIRLVTEPHQYIVHPGVKKVGDKGFGQKILCSKTNGACACCDAGLKPKVRWFLGVIDRRSGAYKILDVSYQVFSQIRKYARNLNVWGDPQKYDLDIVVDKNGGPTGYYAVQPIPHKPLSAADQKLKDEADLALLKQKVTPPSAEYVQKRLEKALDGGELFIPVSKFPAKQGTTASTSSAKPQVDTDGGDEDDDVFPDYNAE